MIYLLIYLIGIFITIWIFKKFNIINPHDNDTDEGIFFISIIFWPFIVIIYSINYLAKLFIKIYDRI